LIITGTDKTLW